MPYIATELYPKGFRFVTYKLRYDGVAASRQFYRIVAIGVGNGTGLPL